MNQIVPLLESTEWYPLLATLTLLTILIYLILLLVSQLRNNLALEVLRKKELQSYISRSNRLLASAKQDLADHSTAWQGTRTFELTKKIKEADSICSFLLKPHDGKPLSAYRPGQFLTFNLTIPGTGVKNTVRCYSLSDAPTHPDHYRLTIKRLGPPADQPDAPAGLSSSYFHDQLQENDYLDVLAPSGDFYLNTDTERPVVLIGGGIGLTPVVSMLNHIAETGSNRETWFFYGVRNGSEHIWKEHFKTLNKRPNISVVVCYSNPNEHDRKDDDYDIHGRVSVELLKQKLHSNNYEFYVCGPPPMMNSIVKDLGDWGVPEEQIHFEAFGPATVTKPSSEGTQASSSESYNVEFSRSNKTVIWDGKHQNLWDFANENSIAIPRGCGVGNCGTCKTAIRYGNVKYQQKPGFQVENGSCLVCCSTPDGDIKLDA